MLESKHNRHAAPKGAACFGKMQKYFLHCPNLKKKDCRSVGKKLLEI